MLKRVCKDSKGEGTSYSAAGKTPSRNMKYGKMRARKKGKKFSILTQNKNKSFFYSNAIRQSISNKQIKTTIKLLPEVEVCIYSSQVSHDVNYLKSITQLSFRKMEDTTSKTTFFLSEKLDKNRVQDILFQIYHNFQFQNISSKSLAGFSKEKKSPDQKIKTNIQLKIMVTSKER